MNLKSFIHNESKIHCHSHLSLDSLVAQTVKCLPTMQETWVQSLGWEDLLEKEMATHSSILVWKIPWTEEPDRLYSPWGRKELDTTEQLPKWLSGQESACHSANPGSIPGSGRSPGEGNCNPLQYSCLENPMDRGTWWATVHGGPNELDTTEVT